MNKNLQATAVIALAIIGILLLFPPCALTTITPYEEFLKRYQEKTQIDPNDPKARLKNLLDQIKHKELDQTRQSNKENISTISRAFIRGLHQTVGNLAGIVGLAGSMVGADNMRDWGFEAAQGKYEDASLYPGCEPGYHK